MKRICYACVAALTGFSASVMAAGITGEAGMGLSYQPHDPTGSRYETRPVPYLDLDWGDVSLSTDDGLTWRAFKANGFSAGPFLNYLAGRTSNGDLQGLKNVPDMGVVGGFVQYAPADFWRVFATVGEAVGGQRGVVGRVGGEIGYPLGGGVIGSSNLTAHIVDAEQNQAFYGVGGHESRVSGFSRYKASGGVQNVALTQSFEFPLAQHWSLLTSASWIHLTGSAADSSIVKQVGRSDQGEVQAAVAYKFD
ncbi:MULTISPECIES: MipA/OmpV family protein [unclassified Pseudomonas]|uniref:MipA/OmpV family protein n=1 Tax=unclassified Pseudomonas TaxID=196821 RepID=UPI002AC9622C|nr:MULTISPECIES: MipA/OmpV family protein [unclassified Pseudomonas]MEB0045017.1 MipA/OmpV family protein [Pseudomonas sp. Dout3]MEB0095971.1 MipA/OmpV family protein [Pseudomonas sp. DC1.2]WPX57837.1 MipA/OmpV family protein [Pseudomonas sp. DC1.2]